MRFAINIKQDGDQEPYAAPNTIGRRALLLPWPAAPTALLLFPFSRSSFGCRRRHRVTDASAWILRDRSCRSFLHDFEDPIPFVLDGAGPSAWLFEGMVLFLDPGGRAEVPRGMRGGGTRVKGCGMLDLSARRRMREWGRCDRSRYFAGLREKM